MPCSYQICIVPFRVVGLRSARQEVQARTRHHALVWLVASVMATVGTSDALTASRHNHGSQHQSKANVAGMHRRNGAGPQAKASAAAGHSRRTSATIAIAPSVPLPVPRPAAASLPPDLAALKQTLELMRQGRSSDASAIAASIEDPVARNLSSGPCCAIQTAERALTATLPSSTRIPTGRAFHCYDGARRRSCGRRVGIPSRCAGSSASNHRSAPLVG